MARTNALEPRTTGLSRGLWWNRAVWWAALCAVVIAILGAFLRFHREGHGFTYVLDFGGTLGLPRLPEVDTARAYIHPGVPGYDGQMYAQLALRPAASDPEVAAVLDNPPYRARRILMSWIAHVAGLGRPAWVLNAQALLNLVTWLGLGVLLLRWFRPGSWVDWIRWSGVMLSAGMLSSVRHALTDGPALLALAGSLALVESGRRYSALVVGAGAGLTRETALLVGAAFAPERWRDPRAWGRAGFACAALAAPLSLWMWHVSALGTSGAYNDGGFANFTWPFAGFAERWLHLAGVFVQRGWLRAHGFSLLLHAALTVQILVVVLRPRWRDPWWRVAAAHVVLLAGLNTQVWEDHPGAAPRVLLPLLLAFNRIVPGRGAWLAVLVAGNLGVFSGLLEMRAPPVEIVRVEAGQPGGGGSAVDAQRISAEVGDGFLVLEGSGTDAWRWTSGDARLRLVNPGAQPVRAAVRAVVRSRQARVVDVWAGAERVASWEVSRTRRELETTQFVIPPGERTVEFRIGVPDAPPAGDARAVAAEFSSIVVRIDSAP